MADRILERDPESVSKEEVMKLKEYNEKYRKYLLKLKSRNAALRAKLNAPSSPDNKEVSSNTSSKQPKLLATKESHVLFDSDGSAVILRTYIVKSGDSLSKISREVYGSSKYYKVIFEANRATMKTEASLKIGQELKIPKLQKK
jgi:nucleoid-associated protein YgaU